MQQMTVMHLGATGALYTLLDLLLHAHWPDFKIALVSKPTLSLPRLPVSSSQRGSAYLNFDAVTGAQCLPRDVAAGAAGPLSSFTARLLATVDWL